MANKKISDLTAKGANLEATDVLEIAEDAGGGTYVTKSITGEEIFGYKRYIAELNQTGTGAPTATVLLNQLGGTVVWTRDSAGAYTGTLAGAFAGTVMIIPPCDSYIGGGLISNSYSAGSDNDDTVYISSSTIDNGTGVKTYTDDSLFTGYSFIEIRVFS